MKLKRDSYLVRWTYVLNEAPDQTSLCAFFWRCFVWMPVFWVLVTAFVGGGVYLFGDTTYHYPWRTLGFVLGVVIVIVGASNEDRFQRASDATVKRISETIFWQGVKAVKGRFCPIITIEGE